MPVGKGGQAPVRPKKVFITGANGFIGRSLLNRYQQQGCEVRGMDLQADPSMDVVAGDRGSSTPRVATCLSILPP